MQTQTSMTDRTFGLPAPSQEFTRKRCSLALAAVNLYAYMRGSDDPEWQDLDSTQQRAFITACLIGAQSVNLTTVLRRPR